MIYRKEVKSIIVEQSLGKVYESIMFITFRNMH